MTREEFLATVTTYPNDINLWYTFSTPFILNGLTVPSVNMNGENIEELLINSTELTLEVQEDWFISFFVRGLQVLESGGSRYVYFDVDPGKDITEVVTTLGFSTTLPGVRVVLNSYEIVRNFKHSPYNVLLNNVKEGVLLNSHLIKGTNTPPNLPESNYTQTGWVNGRYEGTKTSSTNYVGIQPAILGKSFQGVYFPRTVQDSQIKSLSSTATYSSYLFTGTELLPSFTSLEGQYIIPVNINGVNTFPIGDTSNIIPLLLDVSASLSTPKPEVGNIIQVQGSEELIKILKVENYDFNGGWIKPSYKVTVERGYNSTTAEQINDLSPQSVEVNLSKTSQIFKLEKSRLESVQRGKVQVQDSGEILHIDKYGYIISGSY